MRLRKGGRILRAEMGESQRFQLGTIGALSLSVVSSVSIVICNKALMSSLGFTFGMFTLYDIFARKLYEVCTNYSKTATTLTSWHLLVTFCSLHVALWMKLFEHKPFDPSAVMGFGILNGISIGLLNLSLGFNSVGFYQMTKLAIIPCTVLLETLFFMKRFRLIRPSKRIPVTQIHKILLHFSITCSHPMGVTRASHRGNNKFRKKKIFAPWGNLWSVP